MIQKTLGSSEAVKKPVLEIAYREHHGLVWFMIEKGCFGILEDVDHLSMPRSEPLPENGLTKDGKKLAESIRKLTNAGDMGACERGFCIVQRHAETPLLENIKATIKAILEPRYDVKFERDKDEDRCIVCNECEVLL